MRSSVLGGEVVTRLNSSGGKAYTYVPTGGLLRATQAQEGTSKFVEIAYTDPLGVSEAGPNGVAAYDPLGNYVRHYAPVTSQPDFHGPSSEGAWSTFTNPTNLSTGCVSASGVPADCSSRARQVMGDEFADSLPGVYNDMERGERRYDNNVYEALSSQGLYYFAYMRAHTSGYRNANGLFDLDIGNARTLSEGENGGSGAPQDPNNWAKQWDRLRWQGIPLSPCAKRILGDLFNGSALDLNKIRVRLGIPQTLVQAAKITPSAITLGNTIFIDPGERSKYDASTVDGLALLAHETWHSLQYARAGKGTQEAKYILESALEWARGKNPYWDNKYETSADYGAYTVEKQMRDYIKATYGDKPCERVGLSSTSQ